MPTRPVRRIAFFCLFFVALVALLSPTGSFAQSIPKAELGSSDKHEKYVQGRVLVKYKPGRRAISSARLNATIGATPKANYRFVPDMQLVHLPSVLRVEAAIGMYMRDPDVQYAEPDYKVYAADGPNDPLQWMLWGLNNTGVDGGKIGADIKALNAWQLTTGSKDVAIGILDSGVDFTHPDLLPNLIHNPNDCTYNGVDDDGDGFVDNCWGLNVVTDDPFDYVGHGTHTTGTIGAAGNNGIGVAGVNWNVTLIPCKFLTLGGGSDSGAIACLDYMAAMKDRGYNIVATNNSWGGAYPSQAMFDAIRAQMDKGILFIVAAGNDALNNDLIGHYPGTFDLPNVVSVAASDRTDQMATFSDWGKRTVHLSAPGVGIVSTYPTQSYEVLSGTSMATPHVTGVAGLLKAYDQSLDWKAIKNRIMAGGDTVPTLSATLTGKRLNAFGALTCSDSEVLGRRTPRNDGAAVAIGGRLKISVLHVNCGQPAGEIDVHMEPGGTVLTLRDDGNAPDEVAGDGVYSAYFQPQTGGLFTATLPNGDSFTITALKSYDFSSTTYNYRTITGTNLSMEDETVATISAPFPIHFGGQTFSKLHVGDNGLISFDHPFNVAPAYTLPYFEGGAFVAPFWDDLMPLYPGGQNVFWDVVGTAPNRELVVEWRNVPHYYTSDGAITFQVVFSESKDDVLFNYQDVDFFGLWYQYNGAALGTVGIQTDPRTATTYTSYGTFYSGNPLLTSQSSLLWQTKPPDFALTLDNATVTAFAGQPSTISGKVSASNGYDNNVVIHCGTGAPATCGTTSVQPIYSGQPFSINATDTTPNQYQFNLLADDSSAGISHSAALTLNVIDFQLGTPSSSQVTVANGSSASFTAQVSASGPFDRDVTLACNNLPAGVTCAFSPAQISPRPNAPVTVTVTLGVVAETAPQDFSFTLAANAGGSSVPKTQTVGVHVTPVTDFALVPKVNSFRMGSFEAASFGMTVRQQDGYSATVAFSCSVTPVSAATCSVAPATVVPTNDVVVTVAGNGAFGTTPYQINVTGSDGTRTHSVSVPLTLVDYSVTATPITVRSQSGYVWFSIVPVNGFRGTINLGCDVSSFPGVATCAVSTPQITFTSNLTQMVGVSFVDNQFTNGTYNLNLITTLSSGAARSTSGSVTLDGFSVVLQGDQAPVLSVGQTLTKDVIVTPGSSAPLGVDLSVFNCAYLMTCTITPSHVDLTGVPVHATLTVAYPASEKAGTADPAQIMVEAQAPALNATAFAILNLHPQDFALIVPLAPFDNFSHIDVMVGKQSSMAVQMRETGGLNIPVNIECSQDLPPTMTCQFDKATVSAGEIATVTISTTPDAAASIRSVDFITTAVVNGVPIRHVITEQVRVGHFTIQMEPDTLSLPVGEEGVYIISAQQDSAWISAWATVTCTTDAPGVVCEAPLRDITDRQIAVTVRSTPGVTPIGTYHFDVTVTSLGESHTVTGTLNVQGTNAIVLTSPNSYDLWTSGSQTITWKYYGDPGPTVKIELLNKGVVDRLIADHVSVGAAGKGYYTWNIPDDIPFSDYYKIRITSDTLSTATDDSDTRVWVGKGVDFVTNVAGTVNYLGDSVIINYTWSGYNVHRLDLYKGGRFVKTVDDPGLGAGYFDFGHWEWGLVAYLPWDAVPGTDYTLLLVPVANPSRAVMSGPFTISNTGITITSPKKDDIYQPGDTMHIRWNWVGNPVPPGSDVTVTCCGAYNEYVIARAAPLGANGSGGIDWTIPSNMPWGDYYKVAVQANYGRGTASSDAFWVGQVYTLTAIPPSHGQIQVLYDYRILCGMSATQCSAMYFKDASVTLRAVPGDVGYVFSGWTGACSGTGDCVVKVEGDVTVGANFTMQNTFDITGVDVSSKTVTAGASAQYTFSVAPGSQLLNDITLSCSNLPLYAACNFNPSIVPKSSTQTQVALTVTTSRNTSTALLLPNRRNSVLGIVLTLACAIVGIVIPVAKRNRLTSAGLLLVVLAIGLSVSCGGGSGGSGVTPPPTSYTTPPGTYTITVTAKSGTVTRTQNIQLVVQ